MHKLEAFWLVAVVLTVTLCVMGRVDIVLLLWACIIVGLILSPFIYILTPVIFCAGVGVLLGLGVDTLAGVVWGFLIALSVVFVVLMVAGRVMVMKEGARK